MTHMLSSPIPVIDLFAGPGGLGEGFSSLDNNNFFNIIVSAEKDYAAHKTLRLRAFFRLLLRKNPKGLKDYYNFCNGITDKEYSNQTIKEWEQSGLEARKIILGSVDGNKELDNIIEEGLDENKSWVLIGGPPCQAYSLVGRARNKGNVDYKAEEDHRHFLYKEYLRIIQQYHPAIFIMENVKGILSSKVKGKRIFDDILNDLVDPNFALNSLKIGHTYRICSLVDDQVFRKGEDPSLLDPKKFIIKSEEFGIPQARHRVILVGIRDDIKGDLTAIKKSDLVTVKHAIGNLPKLRSKLSKGKDSADLWQTSVEKQLIALAGYTTDKKLEMELLNTAKKIIKQGSPGEIRFLKKPSSGSTNIPNLDEWFLDSKLNVWLNSETRGHMDSDLGRYAYAASFSKVFLKSPKGHRDFNLPGLRPDHKNWESGKFSDRFRVQISNYPSTTITSHISKDGHYFIHYDPLQCRSLTVREAARLQTFPDNYFFQGNRTEQYHQVGNAVPPLLARQIADKIKEILIKQTTA